MIDPEFHNLINFGFFSIFVFKCQDIFFIIIFDQCLGINSLEYPVKIIKDHAIMVLTAIISNKIDVSSTILNIIILRKIKNQNLLEIPMKSLSQDWSNSQIGKKNYNKSGKDNNKDKKCENMINNSAPQEIPL